MFLKGNWCGLCSWFDPQLSANTIFTPAQTMKNELGSTSVQLNPTKSAVVQSHTHKKCLNFPRIWQQNTEKWPSACARSVSDVSSTSIRRWQASLWLQHYHWPQTVDLMEEDVWTEQPKSSSSWGPTNSFSTLMSLWTSSWHREAFRASVCSVMDVDLFCAGGNSWGVADYRALYHPISTLRQGYRWMLEGIAGYLR